MANGVVREMRQRRALSLRDLAARAGVSLSTLHRLEMGLGKPRPRTLRQVAQALGVDPQVLTSAQLRMLD